MVHWDNIFMEMWMDIITKDVKQLDGSEMAKYEVKAGKIVNEYFYGGI